LRYRRSCKSAGMACFVAASSMLQGLVIRSGHGLRAWSACRVRLGSGAYGILADDAATD